MKVRPTILLDIGVLYAFVDNDDERNLDSKAIMLHTLRGIFGSPIIIDYVVVETFLLLKARKLSSRIGVLEEFLQLNRFKIVFVSEDIYNNAMKFAIDKKNQDFLSLTDSSEIVVSRELDYHSIATFDIVLRNFFEVGVGKGYFDQLDEKEKQALLKRYRK